MAGPEHDLFVGALRAGRYAGTGAAAQDWRCCSTGFDLKPGDRLLEIGCGWGTLAIEAAKRGANVVGLTLSAEQKSWAEQKIADAKLSDRIEIRLQDYRETAEQFDAVASVEMVEAVGQRWWRAYLDCIARNLKPGGRAALQFISIDHRLFDGYSRNADFIQAYIFPGGMLLDEPRFEALAEAARTAWERTRRLRPRLCRDAEAVARAL